jgi:hypothetical protein
VLDLLRSLRTPLIRFRAALSKLSGDFESRPIDESFHEEVADSWRGEVKPALADIDS